MTREELKLPTDIHAFTTPLNDFETRSPLKSDLSMRIAIWSLDLALHDFAFFKHSSVRTSQSQVFLIFVIRENEILLSVIL